jgi:hypothetical protein
MYIKRALYTILVIIIFIFFSCKKETSKNSVPEKIISNIEYNKIVDNIISDEILPETNYDKITDNNIPEKILSDDELYEMEQNELKNYLLNNNDLINLGIIFSHEFVKKYGEENILHYYYYNEWDDEVAEINYKQSKRLLLVKINENEYYILIEQSFIPFGEHIVLHTVARIKDNKFVFKTQDGWDNVIVGDFYFLENNVVLKLDCEKTFNFTGRNLAGREYGGDIYVLENRNYRDN